MRTEPAAWLRQRPSQAPGRAGADLGPGPSTRALIAVTSGERADPDSSPALGLAPGAGPPHLPVPPVWQHPFLNVFRQFKVDEWKRSTKEGDVATVMVSEPEGLAEGAWGPLLCLGHLRAAPLLCSPALWATRPSLSPGQDPEVHRVSYQRHCLRQQLHPAPQNQLAVPGADGTLPVPAFPAPVHQALRHPPGLVH